MAKSDDPRYRYESERRRISGDLDEADAAPILSLLDAMDAEERATTFEYGGEEKTATPNTLQQYGQRLRMSARELDNPLLDLTNDDLEEHFKQLLDGSTEIGPADGYSKGTVAQVESALIAFYRFHDGHEVDAEEIPIETQEKSSMDERDLWTIEEIGAMRSKIDSKLDECIFELLAYTGQRIRVIQTLRVKDVDPDHGPTGRYYVNEEVEGRKNREGHGPLLGAKGAVRRWLQVHPTGEPDDALITVYPENPGGKSTGRGTPGERVSQSTIRRSLRRIRDRAGIDKDVHPHMFRHYFTTIALKPKSRGGFGMDPNYVKRLRGDAPGSNVMETTYAHLIDEDASAHAEEQFTGEPVETALTPKAPCGNCGAMLEAGDKACRVCGAVRAPDAEESEVDILRRQVEELKALVSSGG